MPDVYTVQGSGRHGMGPVKPVPDSVVGSPFTVLDSSSSETPALTEGMVLIYPVASIHMRLIDRRKTAAVSASVAAGGTGYSVDDLITVVGGIFQTQAVFRVLTEATGVILTVGMETAGSYTLTPSEPAATSGGNGDATLDVAYSAANPDTADTNDLMLPAGVITQIAVEDGDVLSMFGTQDNTSVYTELAKNTVN